MIESYVPVESVEAVTASSASTAPSASDDKSRMGVGAPRVQSVAALIAVARVVD
jgi:hypothetical protein